MRCTETLAMMIQTESGGASETYSPQAFVTQEKRLIAYPGLKRPGIPSITSIELFLSEMMPDLQGLYWEWR